MAGEGVGSQVGQFSLSQGVRLPVSHLAPMLASGIAEKHAAPRL